MCVYVCVCMCVCVCVCVCDGEREREREREGFLVKILHQKQILNELKWEKECQERKRERERGR